MDNLSVFPYGLVSACRWPFRETQAELFTMTAAVVPACGSEGGPVTLPVFKTGDRHLRCRWCVRLAHASANSLRARRGLSAPAKPLQRDRERHSAPNCQYGQWYPLRAQSCALQDDGAQRVV